MSGGGGGCVWWCPVAGGVRRGAGALSRAARAVRSGPRGDPRPVAGGHGTHRQGGCEGGEGREGGGERASPPPIPGSAAERSSPLALLGAELGFIHRSFSPESKSLGAGTAPPARGGGHRTHSGAGDTTTPPRGGDTTTPPQGGRPPPSCRPVGPTLRY